jgi:CubicO group peptidase (beta-lactamase class C family)
MDDVLTSEQALRLITRQKELNFTPGSRYLYSNGGYVLLAEIVKRVSGSSLAEFTKQNIFRPLKMNETQFCDDYEAIVRNRADSYYQENGVYKRAILNDAIVGPSNLYTTVGDMAKWALNLENPVVGDRELIRRFNEPSLLNNGERAVYYSSPGDVGYHAKGQVVRQYRGLDVRSHGGHAGGFRSTFWRFPGQRFAVVLLSNDEHFAQLSKAEAVIDHFLKDALKPKQSAVDAAAPARPATEGTPPDLRDFEGRYYSEELDTAYTAKVANGKLVLAHVRHGDIPLDWAGEAGLTGRIQFPARFVFHKGASGSVTELRISNFGALNVRFKKQSAGE